MVLHHMAPQLLEYVFSSQRSEWKSIAGWAVVMNYMQWPTISRFCPSELEVLSRTPVLGVYFVADKIIALKIEPTRVPNKDVVVMGATLPDRVCWGIGVELAQDIIQGRYSLVRFSEAHRIQAFLINQRFDL